MCTVHYQLTIYWLAMHDRSIQTSSLPDTSIHLYTVQYYQTASLPMH